MKTHTCRIIELGEADLKAAVLEYLRHELGCIDGLYVEHATFEWSVDKGAIKLVVTESVHG